MKTTIVKTIPVLFFAAILSLMAVSCSQDNNNNVNAEVYNTSGPSSGAQQSPSVNTTATGNLTGTYNTRTNTWQYTITWSSLTSAASAVQLYGPADIGANGNMLLALTITTPGLSGSASGTITLTDEQEAWLLAGRLYYSVITASHVTGEIRGQITASSN
jgi:hypothetical protein